MKKVLLGAALGAAAVYLAIKLHKEGKLDGVYDNLNAFASKAKRDFRNVVDPGKNQVEYLKDRVEYGIQSGKEKLTREE